MVLVPAFHRPRVPCIVLFLGVVACGPTLAPSVHDPVAARHDPVATIVLAQSVPEPPATPHLPPSADVPPPLVGAPIDFAAFAARPGPKQAHTPPVHSVSRPVKLVKRWAARVGKTTFRTTMAHVSGTIVIGTHGASLDGAAESSDGVYVLDAATGSERVVLRPPGGGDLDVGGVALDGDVVFYTTDSGLVAAAKLGGQPLWNVRLQGKVRPAPALGDLDGDGASDVVVGDEHGVLHALRGRDGKQLWSVTTGTNRYANGGFVAAAAIADVDGDGHDDVIAGARDGILAAYRGSDGHVLWQVKHDSGIHASPSVGDLDGNGTLEVLASWAYSDLVVLDAETGHELWGQTVELDDAGIEGLFGSPVPLPGAPGVIVQPTSWWGADDGIVGVGPFERAWKSFEGRVSATGIVTDLDGDGRLEAIVGTEKGKLVSLGPDGSYAELAQLAGPIEATAMVTDVDGDGSQELLVASNDGLLTCFETGSRSQPWLARFRGNDPKNRGELGRVTLGWRARGPLPKTGAPTSSGGVRLDFLECCRALAEAAPRAPTPADKALLRASATCTTFAAEGKSRDEMRAAVRTLTGGSLPDACR